MPYCIKPHPAKKGDTLAAEDHPAVDGVSVDFADATVTLVGRLKGADEALFEVDAVVLQSGADQDPRLPSLRATVPPASNATAGLLELEWHATWDAGATVQTYPREGKHNVLVEDRIPSP